MNTQELIKRKNDRQSLYNLVEAVEDSVSSDEKYLVPFIVKDLLESGRVKVYCTYNDCSQLLH